MLKQGLSQKILQKLSPQQIQLMKLLQIPTATLDQRIKEELESNPALDEGEDCPEVFDADETSLEKKEGENDKEEAVELDDYLREYMEDDPISYKMKTDVYNWDEEKQVPIAVENSFFDHLERQIGLLDLRTENEVAIAFQLVGSIDEDGYLRRDIYSIMDDLLFSQSVEVEKEEVDKVLKLIKKFDPPGVGSKDLKECLIVQLEFKMKNNREPNAIMQKAHRILNDYFNEFTKKHYTKLKRSLSLSDDELKEVIEEIVKLNPKPSTAVTQQHLPSKRSTLYVVPDFIINNRDGELELNLNSKNAPDLRINDHYMEMLKNYKINTKGRRSSKKEKEAVMFIKQKIDSAKWFIDAIMQRQDTLYRTMYTIMQYQYDFFLSGDQRRLRPMILKDIAEITGLDISTVSRVANSKFVQTEFGTKRLKDFFSESIKTLAGEEVSTFEVKNILKEIIDTEDKKKPLSDEKLKDMLQQKGYNIARRTVAKYREQLNIPVARLRKQL